MSITDGLLVFLLLLLSSSIMTSLKLMKCSFDWKFTILQGLFNDYRMTTVNLGFMDEDTDFQLVMHAWEFQASDLMIEESPCPTVASSSRKHLHIRWRSWTCELDLNGITVVSMSDRDRDQKSLVTSIPTLQSISRKENSFSYLAKRSGTRRIVLRNVLNENREMINRPAITLVSSIFSRFFVLFGHFLYFVIFIPRMLMFWHSIYSSWFYSIGKNRKQ